MGNTLPGGGQSVHCLTGERAGEQWPLLLLLASWSRHLPTLEEGDHVHDRVNLLVGVHRGKRERESPAYRV